MPRGIKLLSLVLPVVWVLAAALPALAREDDELRRQLRNLAEAIQKVVKEDPLAVGDFSGPAGADASGGAALQRLLVEELRALGVQIKDRANFELKGDFGKAKNLTTNRDEFKLTVQVLNTETRDVVSTLPGRYVADTNVLIKLLGLTGSLSRFTDDADYRRQLAQLAETPSVFITPRTGIVRSTEDSPFALQVRIRPGGRAPAQPQLPRSVKGRAYFDVEFGDEVVVVLTNNSASEVAATLSLDGLDMFYFAEQLNPLTGRPFHYWVLPPGQSIPIEGWFKRLGEVTAFEVAPLGQGEGSRILGPAAKVGTITATFAPTKGAPPARPTAPPTAPMAPPRPGPTPTATPTAPGIQAAPATPAPAALAGDAEVTASEPLRSFDKADPAELKRGKRLSMNTAPPVVRQSGAVIDFITVRYERPRREKEGASPTKEP
jgi:hypothetical protein